MLLVRACEGQHAAVRDRNSSDKCMHVVGGQFIAGGDSSKPDFSKHVKPRIKY